MGRKGKKSAKSKHQRADRNRVQKKGHRSQRRPGEVRVDGHVKYSRHGDVELIESNLTSDEHASFMAELANESSEIHQTIAKHCQACLSIVSEVHPLHLLKRGYLHFYRVFAEFRSEDVV